MASLSKGIWEVWNQENSKSYVKDGLYELSDIPNEVLKSLQKSDNENWDSESLKYFLDHTFRRAIEEKLVYAFFPGEELPEKKDIDSATTIVFNTGLLSKSLEELFAVLDTDFSSEGEEEEIPVNIFRKWKLSFIATGKNLKDEKWMKKELTCSPMKHIPSRPIFYKKIEELWFNGNIKFSLKENSLLKFLKSKMEEKDSCLEGLPENLKENIEKSEKGLEGFVKEVFKSLQITVKRMKYNYRLSVPAFIRNKSTGKGVVQFVIPINVSNPASLNPEFALSFVKQGDSYEVVSMFSLKYAFRSARLIQFVDQKWLSEIQHENVEFETEDRSNKNEKSVSSDLGSSYSHSGSLNSVWDQCRQVLVVINSNIVYDCEDSGKELCERISDAFDPFMDVKNVGFAKKSNKGDYFWCLLQFNDWKNNGDHLRRIAVQDAGHGQDKGLKVDYFTKSGNIDFLSFRLSLPRTIGDSKDGGYSGGYTPYHQNYNQEIKATESCRQILCVIDNIELVEKMDLDELAEGIRFTFNEIMDVEHVTKLVSSKGRFYWCLLKFSDWKTTDDALNLKEMAINDEGRGRDPDLFIKMLLSNDDQLKITFRLSPPRQDYYRSNNNNFRNQNQQRFTNNRGNYGTERYRYGNRERNYDYNNRNYNNYNDRGNNNRYERNYDNRGYNSNRRDNYDRPRGRW